MSDYEASGQATSTGKTGPRKGRPQYPVTAEWQADVRDKLKRLGIKQSDLARRIGVHRTMVSHMLGPGASRSALVPAVDEAIKRERGLRVADLYRAVGDVPEHSETTVRAPSTRDVDENRLLSCFR